MRLWTFSFCLLFLFCVCFMLFVLSSFLPVDAICNNRLILGGKRGGEINQDVAWVSLLAVRLNMRLSTFLFCLLFYFVFALCFDFFRRCFM